MLEAESPFLNLTLSLRLIEPGEGDRAGRWWWEQDDKKECGLHVAADGTLKRGLAAQEASR
jgi:3'-phosphoadenosine 5'-phosphosulfate sulfotransferase (PAPS reductase)/FAD synthetase